MLATDALATATPQPRPASRAGAASPDTEVRGERACNVYTPPHSHSRAIHRGRFLAMMSISVMMTSQVLASFPDARRARIALMISPRLFERELFFGYYISPASPRHSITHSCPLRQARQPHDMLTIRIDMPRASIYGERPLDWLYITCHISLQPDFTARLRFTSELSRAAPGAERLWRQPVAIWAAKSRIHAPPLVKCLALSIARGLD